MALTMGYNADDVRRSINSVIAAYNELTQVIGDNVQNNFVNKIAPEWACQEAITYFKDFQETMNNLNIAVDNTFKSVVDSMNSAAVAWNQATAGDKGIWNLVNSALVQVPFIKRNKKISIDLIKENINGTRGINPQAPNIAIEAFNGIMNGTSYFLREAKNAVQNSGFLGGNQAQSLINALTQIQNKINQCVTRISHNAKALMNTSLEKYQDVSKRVSNAFQGNKS